MATSKQYFAPETKRTFKGSGGDTLITFASAADQSLSVSDQWDRGAGSKPGLYRWRIKTMVNATVTIGKHARIYLVQTDDATDIPGRVGASDTEIGSANDITRNLGAPIGVVVADLATAATALITTGVCFIHSRYISLGIYNDFGVILHATESNHYFELTPIPPEGQ